MTKGKTSANLNCYTLYKKFKINKSGYNLSGEVNYVHFFILSNF